ncbi:MAG: cation:proton antiporter [Clostridia bacterium]|nr:cation:proton antiporter [Clostridia bacterium]
MSGLISEISPVASVIISIALMLSCGFLLTRLTKPLGLPDVTAYIVTGILIGPYVFGLIPKEFVKGTEFLPDVALSFIAFSTGQFFKLDVLKKNGAKVILITLFEALAASLLVFVLTYLILGLSLAFSIVLAALASATAPASTMMTIRQTRARGDFVNTLLQVVALDDVVSLVAYSIAISVAVASLSGGKVDVGNILLPLAANVAAMIVGALFGVVMSALLKKRSTDNRLIMAIALLFAFCGLCALADISPLLGCMSMSMVYVNITDDDKLFKQLSYWSPPLLLLFFVRSGVNFDLSILVSRQTGMGGAPLLLIGILYFIVRILGKYIGAYAGCRLVKKDKKVTDYLGLALIPQAGVAIGLAALGARTLGENGGSMLETIILSSSVLYELIGPACAKAALHLSGSYSDRIEDLVDVSETNETGAQKSETELLIERIHAIQKTLPIHSANENEEAFTSAAEEYYASFQRTRDARKRFRR